MYYRVPGFLAGVWYGSFPLPSPSPSPLPLYLSEYFCVWLILRVFLIYLYIITNYVLLIFKMTILFSCKQTILYMVGHFRDISMGPRTFLTHLLWAPRRSIPGSKQLEVLNKIPRNAPLKGHANEADFLGFLHKPVRHRPLPLRFEPFRFYCSFEFSEIFVIKKRLAESGSRFSITNISANSKPNSERLER